jgi:hypothetical protein
MGRMVSDVLAVPASGCAVERQFSVSGRMTVWQRVLKLSPIRWSTKPLLHMWHTRCPLRAELDNVDDIDQLPIPEKEGIFPKERMSGWWLNKLKRGPPSQPIIVMVHGGRGGGRSLRIGGLCNENRVFNRYLASYLVTLDWRIYSHSIFSVHYNMNNFNDDVCCASHVNCITSHSQTILTRSYPFDARRVF